MRELPTAGDVTEVITAVVDNMRLHRDWDPFSERQVLWGVKAKDSFYKSNLTENLGGIC